MLRRRGRPVGGRKGEGEGRSTGRSRASFAARRGTNALAGLIALIAGLIAALIVLGIVLVVLKANTGNSIVSAVHDAAKFLVGPFDGIFKPKDHKLEIAINWGIAAAVYLFVGNLLARLLRARL